MSAPLADEVTGPQPVGPPRRLTIDRTHIAEALFDEATKATHGQPETSSNGSRTVGDQLHKSATRSGRESEPRNNPLTRQWFTLADTYEPRSPIEYFLEGILPAASLSILYGAPGTLKTMLALDILVCIASGQPWLSPLPNTAGHGIATSRHPVLFVDFDSGKRIVMERIEALGRGYELNEPSSIRFYAESMQLPWLVASERDSLAAFARDILAKEIKVCVIDNLGVITGKAEENTSDMVMVMSNLRWLAEETGAAVVVIHHERKGDAKASPKAGEALRGHSSINAAVDLALLVEREGQSSIVTVRSTKTRSVPVIPFSANWTFTHKPGGRELKTARFFGMGEDTDALSDASVTKAILSTAVVPLNQSQLVSAVRKLLPGAGLNRIRKLIVLATHQQVLVETPGDNGAKVYQTA